MRANEYRRYAAECLQLADKVKNSDYSAILRAIALAWFNLAEQAEKNDAVQLQEEGR